MSSMPSGSLRRHRLTATDYHRMGDAGILRPDARVELIEGEIIDMAPIGSRHAAAVERLAAALRGAVGDLAMVRTQQPVALDRHSEPEPDVAVVFPRGDYYEHSHPQPRDVLLIVEVADATLAYDRDVKVPLYARCSVPEVWIVDVAERRLGRYRAPSDGEYSERSEVSSGEALELFALRGVRVDLEL